MKLQALTAFDEIRRDEYSEAVEAAAIGQVLIGRVESHAHLQGAQVAYIFRDDEVRQHGKVVHASCHLGDINGKYFGRLAQWAIVHHIVGFQPDFIVLIDQNLWEGSTLEHKVALIDHELSHAVQAVDEEDSPKFNKQTGAPMWEIAGHDVEDFAAVVERHGAWNFELARLIAAAIATCSADITPGASLVKECGEVLAQPAAEAERA